MREFPNNLHLLCGYMCNLPKEQAEEKIKLAERIIREAGENDAINVHTATKALSDTYRELGNIEKAIEYAYKLPDYHCTSNELIRHLLKGENAVTRAQSNIMELTDLIAMNIQSVFNEGNYTDEEKIVFHKYCAKLYELLYEGGEMGIQHTNVFYYYERISHTYAKMNDLENTLENLTLLCDHTVKLIQSGGAKASSLLTNHSRYGILCGGESLESYAERFINNLKDDVFDFCREDERIKILEKKIKVER